MGRIREFQVNEQIGAKEIRLIDETGKQMGIVATPEALRLARERGFDLVLIAPISKPPVARLADYGKLKYELSKKEKETRKAAKAGTIKEVKLSPKIAQHDFEVRVEKTKKLLEKGYKVKVSLFFRGREMVHVDLGQKVMNRLIAAVAEEGKTEGFPKLEGKNLSVLLSPIKK